MKKPLFHAPPPLAHPSFGGTLNRGYDYLWQSPDDNHLYITKEGLMALGLSDELIRKSMTLNKNGHYKTYTHIYKRVRGADIVLFKVQDLSEMAYAKFTAQYGDDFEMLKFRSRLVDCGLLYVKESDTQFFMDFETYKLNASCKMTSSQAVKPMYASATLRALGVAYVRIAAEWLPRKQHHLLVRAMQQDGIPYPKVASVKGLDRIVTEWKNCGYPAVLAKFIPGSFQNGSARKVKADDKYADIEKCLVAWYADAGTKPEFTDLKRLYDQVRADKPELNWPNYSVEWIRRKVMQPKNVRLWYVARNGKGAYRNTAHYARAVRLKPTFPDALASMDGTTIQLVSNDLMACLYYNMCFDVCTGYLTGYAVGRTENTILVKQTLFNTLCNGFKPYQIQYDKGAANTSKVMQELMDKAAKVHFPHRAHNAPAKYAEAFIARLEATLAHLPNFKGSNITCNRNLSRKANSDFIKKRVVDFPDQEGIKAQIAQAVEVWNWTSVELPADIDLPAHIPHSINKYGRKMASRHDIYHHAILPSEKQAMRHKITRDEILSIFAEERTTKATYGVQGIKLRTNGQDVYYYVPDMGTDSDNGFRSENAGKKFRVTICQYDTSMIFLYNDEGANVATAVVRPEFAACIADKAVNENLPTHHQFTENRDADERTADDLLKEWHDQAAKMTGLEELSFELLHKDQFNAAQHNRQMQQLGLMPGAVSESPTKRNIQQISTQTNTSTPKKIAKVKSKPQAYEDIEDKEIVVLPKMAKNTMLVNGKIINIKENWEV